MRNTSFIPLASEVAEISPIERVGLVTGTSKGIVQVSGLSSFAAMGDLVQLADSDSMRRAEVVDVSKNLVHVLPDGGLTGISVGDEVTFVGAGEIRPDISWVGRIVDAYANPLDGLPLLKGPQPRPVRASPPPAAQRKRLGPMLETGISAFNTFLPIVQGQRIGLFAGSGVGKSSLLAMLAQRVEADYIVIALVGERGREVREFVEDTLGTSGKARSVVVAATSDQSPVTRRRAAWTAMSIAEYLRDQGAHVLLLMDSVTRFCEAHREVVSSTGEPASIRGFPPSTTHNLMELCERSGPGPIGTGDITAVMSVLVAGSDMDEPVADMVRGVLDGHVILDRSIAERGRFPAVDVLRSVSRSFLSAMDSESRKTVRSVKQYISAYEEAEIMIQTGLYQSGSDRLIDASIQLRPQIETFLSIQTGEAKSTAKEDQICLRGLIEKCGLVEDE